MASVPLGGGDPRELAPCRHPMKWCVRTISRCRNARQRPPPELPCSAFPLRDSFFASTREAFLVVSLATRDAMRLFLGRIAVPIGYQMREVSDSGLAQEAFHAMIRPLKNRRQNAAPRRVFGSKFRVACRGSQSRKSRHPKQFSP